MVKMFAYDQDTDDECRRYYMLLIACSINGGVSTDQDIASRVAFWSSISNLCMSLVFVHRQRHTYFNLPPLHVSSIVSDWVIAAVQPVPPVFTPCWHTL